MTRGAGAGEVRSEGGAATVWALALVHLILVAALVSAAVGSLALTRQRAATVADIAALAGAQALTDPCRHAGAAAAANGMELLACATDGVDVVVTVRAPPPELIDRLTLVVGRTAGPVTASARAGAPP